ncbi:MAG: Metalloprotease TldD [Gammaproteobacteria bacterium]|nr:Metalloprotease TldD [Gammaproteobacteria bacterium]
MSDSLALARQQTLAAAALEDRHLEQVLNNLLDARLDYADLYFEHSRSEGWTLEDGIVKEGSHSIGEGVGVRAVAGEKTGFAYADEIAMPALQDAAGAARAIAGRGGNGGGLVWQRPAGRLLYRPLDPVETLAAEEKVRLLQEIDTYARALDPRVTQVIVSLTGQRKSVLVAASDGTLAGDVRPLVRLNVTVIVEESGRRETGTYGGGGRYGYEWLTAEDRIRHFAREAVRQAVLNLDAGPAPAGEMTVVLGPGWPGILLHEAIGHGLEGDFNRKRTSAFAGRIGERVAAAGVTVVDDGTLPGRRGSLNVDDEGTPTRCTVLIEDGILRGYMQDKQNARLMRLPPTGNGRRQSYAHRPMPRMTNTYMLPGPHDPQEIIATVDRGLYAVNFGGGQVDITNGKFVFSAAEAYLIEKGRVTRPVKGATLIGNGPDVLTRVSMIGNDLQLDAGVGTCGKNGQSVPVCVGQPTLRIDNLTVGGTSSR